MTQLIASRVAALRAERRLSGAALSRRVRELGMTSWTDSTISKLETGRRESVSIREWFALALALDVSPMLLLADPRAVKKVPVGKVDITNDDPGHEIELDAWTALLWMCGMARPDEKVHARTYGRRPATDLLVDGMAFAERVQLLLPQLGDGLNLPESASREPYVRDVMRSLATLLQQIEQQGAPLPVVPSRIVRAAAELGVELPGQEQDGPEPHSDEG